MGTGEVVAICGVLPALWIWLLSSPKREMRAAKVEAKTPEAKTPEARDWRDDLDWRQ